jgi:hypothetical protein
MGEAQPLDMYFRVLREESSGPAPEAMARPGQVSEVDVVTLTAVCKVTVGSVTSACVPRKAVRRRRKTLCLCTGPVALGTTAADGSLTCLDY